MPNGKRSQRISQRDLEILEFIARFGLIPRRAVATWAATARTVTIVRESRLRAAGLVAVHPPFGDLGPLVCATRAGLRACGRAELGLARASLHRLRHEAVVAELAAAMERGGERLLSEREICARERAAGARLLSAGLPDGRYHRPDLVALGAAGEPRTAIEVELTTKGAARLDALLRAWRGAVAERRFERVVYRCQAKTRPYVEAALKRTQTATAIGVAAL